MYKVHHSFLSFLLLCLFFLVPLASWAQEIQVQAPPAAGVGEPFQVTFVVNGDTRGIQPPKVNGARAVQGPFTSSSTSISFVNGHRESSHSTSFTYVYVADNEGSANFGSAVCNVDGKQWVSHAFSVKIVKESQQPRRQQRQSAWDDDPFEAMQRQMQQMMGLGGGRSSQRAQQQQQQPATIDGNTLFARASLSNTHPYEGEQVIVTYKIYTQVSLRQFQIDKLPGNKGFWAEDLTGNRTSVDQHEETINGKRYMVAEIRRGALFAQENGALRIAPLDLDVLAMVPRPRRGSIFDLFDDPFFNMGQAVERHLQTNTINVNVKPLPTAPEGFFGAVGKFSIKATVDNTKVRANEAITYKVTVTGSGNLPLINAPAVDFPSVFEVYDPQVIDNISRNSAGVSGSRTFEWVLIPRNQGKYTIPALTVSYFDPQQGKYVSSTLDAFDIQVDKADPRATQNVTSSQQDLNVKNDINYIKLNHNDIRSYASATGTQWWFWALLAFIAVASAFTIVYVRRLQRANQDIAGVRLKRSTRQARRRLKKAAAHLKDGNDDAFYEEVYKAIWGCLADKYNIELSQLSTDTVLTHLDAKHVDDEHKQQILQTLHDVDFARFAPGDSSQKKHNIYDKALDMIRNISFVVALLVAPALLSAQPAQQAARADQAYKAGHYQLAIEQYEGLLASGSYGHSIYYNLGNAYYRQGLHGRAILNYRRALLLRPYDSDTRDNLALARTRCVDRIELLPSVRFNRALRSVVDIATPVGWQVIVVVLAALLAASFCFYRLSSARSVRKSAFLAAMFVGLLLIVAAFCCTSSVLTASAHNEVVVVQPEIAVMASPDEGATMKFPLHEGAEATIDETLSGWYRIRVNDGNNGWVRLDDVERI